MAKETGNRRGIGEIGSQAQVGSQRQDEELGMGELRLAGQGDLSWEFVCGVGRNNGSWGEDTGSGECVCSGETLEVGREDWYLGESRTAWVKRLG